MLGRVLDAYRAAFRGLPREVWLLSWVMLVNRVAALGLPLWLGALALRGYVSRENAAAS